MHRNVSGRKKKSVRKGKIEVKAVKYGIKLIYEKRIAITSSDKKSVEGILRAMLASGEITAGDGELSAVITEELEERDCPGNCEGCGYFCPHREDCMIDDVEIRCPGCAYYCRECGRCELKGEKACGGVHESCGYSCPECGGCTRPSAGKTG